MNGKADGDELEVCSPIKKQPLPLAPSPAAAPAAAEGNDSEEFAELDAEMPSEVPAGGTAEDAIAVEGDGGGAKRARKPVERFATLSEARPPTKSAAKKDGQETRTSTKRGPRGRDENGNPIKLKYSRLNKDGADALAPVTNQIGPLSTSPNASCLKI